MKESEEHGREAGVPRVVEVIPIMKGLPNPALSYFYSGDIREGEFVEIEVRKSAVLALVSKVRDAREMKSGLRNATYSLKKIIKKRPDIGVPKAFVAAAERTAQFYASTTGAVLGAVLPKLFLTEPDRLCFGFPAAERTQKDPVLIELEQTERFSTYKSIIRENFAKSRSVLFIAASNELARRASKILSQGIEEYAYLFALDLDKRMQGEVLKKASSEKHPILFITTPAGIVFDRPDLAIIILEGENTQAFRTRTKPYISTKTFIEHYARAAGKELIIGDTVLSLETLHKEKTGAYAEFVPLKWRVTDAAEARLVDMKKPRDASVPFEIFSPELRALISMALKEDRQIFLFGARKGLSSATVCGDCGDLLACTNCGAPVVLHKKNAQENIYICHACGATRSPETRCDNCTSWKLVPLGIGIERIAEEASALWPDAPVYIFDKDHLKDARAARALAKKIQADRAAIVVGTELYPLYRDSIPYSAVVSLDSLFAVPDFGVHERIFSLVTKIREMTEREVLIQTRNIGKDILVQASKGNILEFYRAEISDRKTFFYPPFSIFIKVLIEASESEVSAVAGRMKSLFDEWNPEFMKRKTDKKHIYVVSMTFRLERSAWPDAEVLRRLTLLGPRFLIKVDPESIL